MRNLRVLLLAGLFLSTFLIGSAHAGSGGILVYSATKADCSDASPFLFTRQNECINYQGNTISILGGTTYTVVSKWAYSNVCNDTAQQQWNYLSGNCQRADLASAERPYWRFVVDPASTIAVTVLECPTSHSPIGDCDQNVLQMGNCTIIDGTFSYAVLCDRAGKNVREHTFVLSTDCTAGEVVTTYNAYYNASGPSPGSVAPVLCPKPTSVRVEDVRDAVANPQLPNEEL